MKLVRQVALVVALVLFGATTATAQVRPDSVRTDSTRRPGQPPVDTAPTLQLQRPAAPVDTVAAKIARARADSIAKFRAGDTVKAPLARFEMPRSFEIDGKLRFNREQILTSESNNLADLLERVPGITTYRTGWLASVHVAGYLGDFAHLRVFMDGVEMDAPDTRSNGVLDLSDVYLWLLDEIVIERVAGEVRVWCRSFTTIKTTAYTRTDIFTGDLNTNGFRGIFARRYTNGFALQFAGTQLATQQGRSTIFSGLGSSGRGNGGNQTLSARVGWARSKLSFDVNGVVTTRDRDLQSGDDSIVSIDPFRGARREAYARVGYGDTAGGFWSQMIWNALVTRLEGIRPTDLTDTLIKSDTSRSITQRVFAVGYSTNAAQFSLTDRMRTFGGKSYHAPAARAAYTAGSLSAGAFVEGSPLDSSRRFDGSVRLAPLSRVVLMFNETVRTYDKETLRSTEQVARADLGLRINRFWATAGVIQQTETRQALPTVLIGPLRTALLPKARGVTFGGHGLLYKDLGLDIQGIGWSTGRAYLPQLGVRTDLSLQSDWRSHFPKGQFSINAHIIHEFRNPVTFFFSDTTATGEPLKVVTRATQIYTGILELRLQNATLFYQFHNISGQAYEITPAIPMPRQVQYYGVRWVFFN